MTKRKIDYWVIPPEADGEFVAHMEEVLETYAQPYEARHPVVCMDEQPIQLLSETRVPVAATKVCPNCHTSVPAAAMFCTTCGYNFAAAPAAPAPEKTTVTCPNCHFEVPAGSVFCPNCGGRVIPA